jgi:hypothetical protein
MQLESDKEVILFDLQAKREIEVLKFKQVQWDVENK